MFNGERIISSTNLLVGRYNLTTRTGRTRKLINVNPRMKKMIYKNAKIKTKTTVVVRQKEETPKKPTKPTNLTATPGDKEIIINYTAPNQGSSPITSYIWEGAIPEYGWTWGELDLSSVSKNITDNSITFINLTNGVTYEYRTRAINNVGNGPWSNSVSAEPSTVPDKVQNLRATSKNKAVDLSWDTPNNNGKPISSYKYEQTVGNKTVEVELDPTLTTHTISGLVNGQTYSFKMRAINGGWGSGNGAWSDSVSSIPAAKYPTYKTWRILYSSTPSSRIPYTCGIRFFNENGALLELNLKKIFRSGAGGSGNWAKHQPGNFDLNFSYAQAVSGDKWFGHHFETTQMISKIHIGSTASLNHIPTYSWGSLLGGRSFPEFLIQGSNNASNTEIGGLRTTMTGNWTTIMTVTANDLYEPSPITDTRSTAAKGKSTSYIQGNQLTMRIIELPTS
jgi:hypothetical protein